jgi:5-methylcytosine-specific restriction endonuclease McrA
MDFFGYGEQDFCPCENCGSKAVDVHHINYRSHCGEDVIDNLIGLCRSCHNAVHNGKIGASEIFYMHKVFMNRQNNILIK